jgi:hypothetical protein
MAREQATLGNRKSIASAVLAGLGLVILLWQAEVPTTRLDSILSCATRETIGLLPYIIPAAWRALQSYVFDHQGPSPCLFQILVSCWSLVHGLAVAA